MTNLIVQPLRNWAAARLRALYDNIAHTVAQNVAQTLAQPAVRERIPAPVQRIGTQTWRRVLARWPQLGEFVTEQTASSPASAQPGPAPAASAPGTEAPRPAPATAAVPSEQVQSTPAPAPSAEPAAAVGSAEPPAPPSEDPVAERARARELWLAILVDGAARWQARADAARALADAEGEPVAQALIAALRDRSAEVAASAATALAAHHTPEVIDALRGVLANPKQRFHALARAAAVTSLAACLDTAELAPVAAAIRDQDAEVSIAAIAALAERAPDVVSEHVLPVLRDGNGYFLPLVRLAAVHALRRAGALDAALVEELLVQEGDAQVRAVLGSSRPASQPQV